MERDQLRITINHFELKKESEEEENFLKDHQEAPGEVILSDLANVELESSRGEMTEEPQKNSLSTRTKCGSCLLFLVKCLDLLININIIGLNYLNFTIRNIWNVHFSIIELKIIFEFNVKQSNVYQVFLAIRWKTIG